MSEPEVFKLDEIAVRLKISKSSARRLFASEPGVLVFNASGKRSSPNGRVSIRVPRPVYDRVVNRMQRVS